MTAPDDTAAGRPRAGDPAEAEPPGDAPIEARPARAARLRIALAVVTRDRAELLAETLPLMLEQTRPADRCLIVAARQEDVAPVVERFADRIEIQLVDGGLSRQRNAALAAARDDCDAIVFFADDFRAQLG